MKENVGMVLRAEAKKKQTMKKNVFNNIFIYTYLCKSNEQFEFVISYLVLTVPMSIVPVMRATHSTTE